jgi:hypothetical protein
MCMVYLLLWIADKRDMKDDSTNRNVRAGWRRKSWRLLMFTMFLVCECPSALNRSLARALAGYARWLPQT